LWCRERGLLLGDRRHISNRHISNRIAATTLRGGGHSRLRRGWLPDPNRNCCFAYAQVFAEQFIHGAIIELEQSCRTGSGGRRLLWLHRAGHHSWHGRRTFD
jgi:hypothetical protein